MHCHMFTTATMSSSTTGSVSPPSVTLTSDGDDANTADTPAINIPVLTQFKC